MSCHSLIKDNVKNTDIGKLILRVSIAILLLPHGLHKLMYGIGDIKDLLSSMGLPAFVAYGVFAGELIAPILLIVGAFTRFAAIMVMGNMIFAWYLVDSANTFKLTTEGGLAIEGALFYFLSSAAVLFMGAGKFSLSGCYSTHKK